MRRLVFLNSEENSPEVRQALEETSRRMGFSFILAEHSVRDFTNAFALVRRERPDAMHVSLSPGSFQNRHSIVEFAADCRLPTIYPMRSFTDAGGLISLGANFEDLSRCAAGYVVRILEGASPADLPVEQPNKFDVIVNLRTAKALGLAVPASVLVQTTEVIE